MIVLEKVIDSINDVYSTFSYAIGFYSPIVQSMHLFLIENDPYDATKDSNIVAKVCNGNGNENNDNVPNAFMSYEDVVRWALYVCNKNIPSPFKLGFPTTCHSLNLSTDYFTIRFPNNIGIGVKVFSNKKGIQYSLNIVFFNSPGSNDTFIRETEEYKNALKCGWTVKPNTKNQ